MCESYKIPVRKISSVLGGKRVAGLRLKEAFQQQYIIGPEIRKKSYANLREYMYFVNCKDPDLAYLKYRKDENVIYHAQMGGFCNLWMITKDKIDVEEDIVLEGYRSDYYTAFVPDRSWEKAMETMRTKIEKFDPDLYSPKGFIKIHWDTTVKWDSKDEVLYRYFKYFLRNPLSPVMRKYRILKDEIYAWFDRLPECCTIATSYYPDTVSAYDPYLFMFETEYEDFVINLFTQFPTSSSFFKVSDRLFVYAHVARQFIRGTDLNTDSGDLYIPSLLVELLKRKIVKSKARARVEYYRKKDL